MPGFRKNAGRRFLLQQHMAAGERIERGGTKRIAELFHVKHRRGSVCVNVSRETLGIVAHCVSGMRLQPPLLFLLLRKRNGVAALQAAGTFCAPHFFFLVRKKKRVAPGAKKKERAAAFNA